MLNIFRRCASTLGVCTFSVLNYAVSMICPGDCGSATTSLSSRILSAQPHTSQVQLIDMVVLVDDTDNSSTMNISELIEEHSRQMHIIKSNMELLDLCEAGLSSTHIGSIHLDTNEALARATKLAMAIKKLDTSLLDTSSR